MPDHESSPEQSAQSSEPGHEEPEVVAGRGQNGIDRVAMSPEQPIALNQAVTLQVPDHGLNGVAPMVSASSSSSRPAPIRVRQRVRDERSSGRTWQKTASPQKACM